MQCLHACDATEDGRGISSLYTRVDQRSYPLTQGNDARRSFKLQRVAATLSEWF